MFDGDPRRLELAYSLMFTFPGTPVMRYGDFSSASPDRLIRPIISGGPYGYEGVNVASQHCDPDSLLYWMEHAIRINHHHVELKSYGYRWFRIRGNGP